MSEFGNITEGLNRKLDAEELLLVQSEIYDTVASGLEVALQETGDVGEALDCLIISARAYLAQVEHLREIYVNGLN